ncbi:chaplin family protein, partial [Arthrobacter sp. CC3]|uniref:chaplin family protein n=1 Tax=Arthrobacter sp. CC3 TaxID=3029185 RepID=UPI003266E0EF
MHANIRRGLLSTLFAGGLLALGSTAASAADTTSGSDGLASGNQVIAPVTAPVTVGTTSLGLLGDSTATDTTTNNGSTAPAETGTTGSTTNGSDGLASGTQVIAPVTAPATVGTTSLGLLGDSTATGNTGTTTAPAGTNTSGSTNGSDGLASGTQVIAPVTAPVTVGTTSLGLLGDSTATGNTGTTTAP